MHFRYFLLLFCFLFFLCLSLSLFITRLVFYVLFYIRSRFLARESIHGQSPAYFCNFCVPVTSIAFCFVLLCRPWGHNCSKYSDCTSWSTQCSVIAPQFWNLLPSHLKDWNVVQIRPLCKPTHRRHLWELCLSITLQMLDWLIDWLRDVDCRQKRNELLKDVNKELAPTAIVEGTTVICSRRQLSQIIDTTLLKCYLKVTNLSLVWNIKYVCVYCQHSLVVVRVS